MANDPQQGPQPAGPQQVPQQAPAPPDPLQAIQDALEQLVNRQQPQPPARVAAPFALYPGRAFTTVLDFTIPADLKYFNKAISPMTTKYSLSPDTMKVFLANIKERANLYNWDDIMNVPVGGIGYYITDQYGMIEMSDCQAAATAYIGQAFQTRDAQNNVMLFQYISDSLTDEAKNEIGATEGEYIVNGSPSGICFLKAIIGRATVDTIATVNTLRNAIANLETRMKDMEYNVKTFNTYVRHQKNALLARGQAAPELMLNLFKAYESIPNPDYVMFVKNKRSAWEEGAPLSVELLMTQALNKYNLMNQDGSWGIKDTQAQTIFALQAQIADLTSWVHLTNDHNEKGAFAAVQQSKMSEADKAGVWAWKKVKPLPGETQKTFRKKKYHWCHLHQAWTIHEAINCTLATGGAPQRTPNAPVYPQSTAAADRVKRTLALSAALQAIADEDCSED